MSLRHRSRSRNRGRMWINPSPEKSSKFPIWLICIIAVTACVGQVRPETPTKAAHYWGRLVDGTTGEPIEAARMTLVPSIDDCVWRTDSEGRFSFWAPLGSKQRLIAEADGYESVSLLIHSVALHDIRLSRSSAVQPTASREKAELMPPSQAVAPAIVTADSEPKLSGKGRDWSRWYRLEIGKAPGGYRFQHAEFWLSGDRSCGTSAQCREVIENDQKVAWEYQLQGHTEDGAPRQTYSTAHMRVLYRPK